MPRVKTPTHVRLVVIQVFVAFWMAAIGAKLVYLQLDQHESLLGRAERQQQATIDLTPIRGILYDRHGNELARSARAKSLWASPPEVQEPEVVAGLLSRVLDVDRETILRRLTADQMLVAIKRKLSDEEASRVESLELAGLRFVPEMKRFYLAGSTAAHVLGFVDFDQRGMAGVEQTYDRQISGRGGKLILYLDARKRSYNHSLEESIPGANGTLTIDTMIQRYVEKALANAVRGSGARGGTIVVMRPSTGEILALANYPTFDPNRVSESTEAMRRNRAVEVAFEPGSIFKIVAYSAALEEGLIEPNTLIDCGNGELRMPGRVIHDGHYGMLTASQALAKSSNVAAIRIGQLLGNERLAHYIDAFGFWRRTGIELPGESRGVFRPASQWDATSIGSIPMGHEISVTAVQAVAAFACIANGGEWVQPYVVARVTSSAGDVLQEAQRESRRVVSESTAVTLKAMLEGVVARGTGKKAQIGGYRAAGKTGTAQKVDEATRRYSKTRFVASFAGFAPVDSPEIACIVSIDEPRGPHQGGEAAAPVFALVVAEILHMLGVPPEGNLKGHLIASNAFVEAYGSQTTGSAPLRQVSLEHPEWADPPEVASKPSGGIVVPDLTGYGIREVAALCNRLGLQMRASGEGLVETQSPRAGLLVAQNTICHVRFSKTVRKERPRTFAYTSNSASTAPNGQQVRSDRQ